MSENDIVRMANQIADNFSSLPEDEAVAEIAAHIESFWEPRMRAALARLAASGDARLQDTVRDAAERLFKTE